MTPAVVDVVAISVPVAITVRAVVARAALAELAAMLPRLAKRWDGSCAKPAEEMVVGCAVGSAPTVIPMQAVTPNKPISIQVRPRGRLPIPITQRADREIFSRQTRHLLGLIDWNASRLA